MSAAILPNGSVVVRLPSHTVHVDVRTRAIHLRAASNRDELSGSILESFPLTAVDRVRVVQTDSKHQELYLALRSGRRLDLGLAPTHEVALMTARIVADVTRCKVEVSGGIEELPGPSESFSSKATMENLFSEPTPVVIPLDSADDPTSRIYARVIRVGSDEFPTDPPSTSDLLLEPTAIAKTKVRARLDSWRDMHEQRDVTLEDAFEVDLSDWPS